VSFPNLHSLNNPPALTQGAHLSTSTSGGINNILSTASALCSYAELSIDRLTLPADLRDELILLFVDRDSSRRNLEALLMFDRFNVGISCLSGDRTHVIQPFDMTVASPLKTAFKPP
jgi:hypothetical protein